MPQFLYYFLESHKDALLVPLMKGAANVSLSIEKIGSVSIPVPSLPEQSLMIKDLRQVDSSIDEAKERLFNLQKSKTNALAEFKSLFSE